MKLTFRQGLARYQTDVYATPTFLRKSVPSGEYIDLIVSPDPTIIIFAHKGATYLVEESRTVQNAWGPFSVGGSTKYLYWDINLLDASLTRGFTAIPPFTSALEPEDPVPDTHWFDTNNHFMKVWNGRKWVEKIRVFAATYSHTGVIVPMGLGTQAGQSGTFDAGNLVLDSYFKPMRQSDGTFLTSSTELSITNGATQKVKIESEIVACMAEEYIPKYSWVRIKENRRIRLGRSDDWKTRIAGIVNEDLYESEVGEVTTNGLVRNEQWNWPQDKIGRPVFCSPTGEVVLSPPYSGVCQICGYIFDTDAIEVRIQAVTILSDLRFEVEAGPANPALAPIADFVSASKTVGTVPYTVTLNSTTIHEPNLLQWDFTNSGAFDAAGETATFIYTKPGTYSVRLRATNEFGVDEEIKPSYITVDPLPPARLKTNLSITLGGPMQVGKNQTTSVSVMVTNDGKKKATLIHRFITVMDVGGVPLVLSNLPVGTIVSRVKDSTLILLPELSTLASGGNNNVTFKVTAPDVISVIEMRGSVLSPEIDSNLADNYAELFIRVR